MWFAVFFKLVTLIKPVQSKHGYASREKEYWGLNTRISSRAFQTILHKYICFYRCWYEYMAKISHIQLSSDFVDSMIMAVVYISLGYFNCMKTFKRHLASGQRVSSQSNRIWHTTTHPGKVIRSDWNEGVQEKLNKKVLNIWKQTYFVSSVRSSSHTKKMYLGRICWIFKAYLQPQASICRFQKSPWKVISGVSIKSIGVLKMIQNQVQTVFDQYLAPGLKYLDTSSVKRWVSQFMLVKKMPSQFEAKYFWTICQLEMFGDRRRVLFCSFAANSQVAATSATFLAKFFQANPHFTGIEQQTKSFIQQESIIQHIAPIPLELNNDQDHKRWSSTKNWH